MVLFVDIAGQCAPQVPTDLLAAIATVESGLNPLAVRVGRRTEVVGSVGHGVAAVVGELDAGGSVGVGLMGLDGHTLAAQHVTPIEAFDACRNLEVAGRILDALLKAAETAGLSRNAAERQAIRAYFVKSGQEGTPAAYEAKVSQERAGLQTRLNRLSILWETTGPLGLKSSQRSSAEVSAEGHTTASRASVAFSSMAQSQPSRSAYGSETAAGLVIFSK